MAIYRKIYEEVEAARYVSGAKDALTIKGVSIEPYVSDTAKSGAAKDLCSKCGKEMSKHGMRKAFLEYDTICPGTFVMIDEDGRIRYRTEAEFLTRYEEVKV
jgi:hypothetical protein